MVSLFSQLVLKFWQNLRLVFLEIISYDKKGVVALGNTNNISKVKAYFNATLTSTLTTTLRAF